MWNPGFPHIRMSGFPDIRISGFRFSGFPEFRISGKTEIRKFDACLYASFEALIAPGHVDVEPRCNFTLACPGMPLHSKSFVTADSSAHSMGNSLRKYGGLNCVSFWGVGSKSRYSDESSVVGCKAQSSDSKPSSRMQSLRSRVKSAVVGCKAQ